MQEFDIAIVVTIEANTYDSALRIAENIAEDLGRDYGETAEAVTNYAHDFSGNRLLTLHPEDAIYYTRFNIHTI